MFTKVQSDSKKVKYSRDPVSDRLTKRTITDYGPPSASPDFFPIHIMYYRIQKAGRPTIRDTDHPVSVPNHANRCVYWIY